MKPQRASESSGVALESTNCIITKFLEGSTKILILQLLEKPNVFISVQISTTLRFVLLLDPANSQSEVIFIQNHLK
jgi:hypothetical protein